MSDDNPQAAALASLAPIFDMPLLVSSEHFETFMQCLRSAVQHEDYGRLTFEAARTASDDKFWDQSSYLARYYRPYSVSENILTIPVRGALMNRMGYQFGSYMTGYEYIRKAVERGLSDPRVHGIAFDIDSTGGTVAGNFELTGYIAEQRGRKPMRAYSNGLALSGGYSIATAADDIVVSPSGMTGSVGVVISHADVSKMLENVGVDITLIYAGARKVDGHPSRPLSDEAHERMQAQVDKSYDKFVDLVARNRSISYDDVRASNGGVFDSEESVEIGFADRVAEHRTDIADFSAQTLAFGERTAMTDKPETKAEAEPKVDAAKIAADARVEERQRFADVQASEEFVGREPLANKLLATTDMTAEQIVGVLASAERKAEKPAAEAPTDGKSAFAKAMDKAGTPGVESEDGAEQAASPQDRVNDIFAAAGYAPAKAA